MALMREMHFYGSEMGTLRWFALRKWSLCGLERVRSWWRIIKKNPLIHATLINSIKCRIKNKVMQLNSSFAFIHIMHANSRDLVLSSSWHITFFLLLFLKILFFFLIFNYVRACTWISQYLYLMWMSTLCVIKTGFNCRLLLFHRSLVSCSEKLQFHPHSFTHMALSN